MDVSIKNELGNNSIKVFQMAKDKNKLSSINKITSLLSKFLKIINLFSKTEKCPHKSVKNQSKITKDIQEIIRMSPKDKFEKNILTFLAHLTYSTYPDKVVTFMGMRALSGEFKVLNKNMRILITLGFILLQLLELQLLSFIFSSTSKTTNIKFNIKRFLQLSNEYDS